MAETSNGQFEQTGEQTTGRRARARKGLEVGKQRARSASESLQRKIGQVGEASADAVAGRPLAAVAGAVAVGAAAAALIPVTRREAVVVGPLGERARGAIDQAVQSAKSAGIDHLTAQGLTSAALTSGLGGIIGAIVKTTLAAGAKAEAEPAAEPTTPVPHASTAADAF